MAKATNPEITPEVKEEKVETVEQPKAEETAKTEEQPKEELKEQPKASAPVAKAKEEKVVKVRAMEPTQATIAGVTYSLKKDETVDLPEGVAAILINSRKVVKL